MNDLWASILSVYSPSFIVDIVRQILFTVIISLLHIDLIEYMPPSLASQGTASRDDVILLHT